MDNELLIERHDDGTFRCLLCDTGRMNINNARGHINGGNHRWRKKETVQKEFVFIRVNVQRLLRPHIAMLDLAIWRMHVKAEILDSIDAQDSIQVSSAPSERIWMNALNLLAKYEKIERISLLELAVWRASCLSFDGCMDFDTMQDILDRWAMDEDFDPVEYKKQRRYSSQVAVVIREVLPFLS